MAFNVSALHVSGSVCNVEVKSGDSIVKSCKIAEKGIDNGHDKLFYEAMHIRSTPFAAYFPAVNDISYDGDTLRVDMQYLYGGTTLADLLRDPAVSDDYFDKSLDYILRDMFDGFFVPQSTAVRPDYLDKFYLLRTRERMETMLGIMASRGEKWGRLERALLHGAYINGSHYPGVFQYLAHIGGDAQLLRRLQVERTYNTHHDLIPGNILVDTSGRGDRVSDYKLIDPRGALETGFDGRHYMYDVGKLLFGLDCYDIIRMAHRDRANALYTLEFTQGGDADRYELRFSPTGTARYRRAFDNCVDTLRGIFEANNPGGDWDTEYLRYLFSFAFMYHPDIPCRMVDENTQDMSLMFCLRGLMAIRLFMDAAYGIDPLRRPGDTTPVDMWGSGV
jgi:hypothetical protein